MVEGIDDGGCLSVGLAGLAWVYDIFVVIYMALATGSRLVKL